MKKFQFFSVSQIVKEFKEFILKGNVLDMAVGVVIGAAFGKVVDSLVKDIIMPPIGIILGKIDFSGFFITLADGTPKGPYASLELAKRAGAVTLNIGNFFNMLLSLIIIGMAIFMVIKIINKLRRENQVTEPLMRDCPKCFSHISKKASRCPYCTSEITPINEFQ